MNSVLREIGRKTFHMLCLVYYGAFLVFGWPTVGFLGLAWLTAVFALETARLKIPAFGRALAAPFEKVIRDGERAHYSGILFTTAGSLAAMAIADGRPMIVGAAIGQLAFCDAAAAIVGKAFGRTRVLGGQKSLEGSLAGLAAGFAAAIWFHVGPGPAFASALVATLVELMPTSAVVNDNFWIPVASAAVLRAFGVR